MRYLLIIVLIVVISHCKKSITTIISVQVLDSNTKQPLDGVEIKRYPNYPFAVIYNESSFYYTDTCGKFNDTVFLLNSFEHPLNPKDTRLYLDNKVILSKKGYQPDTIEVINLKDEDAVEFYNSLDDTTININLYTIYQYSPSGLEKLELGYSNKNGFFEDTIKKLITGSTRGAGAALYFPEQLIVSRYNYKADTIKLLIPDTLDPISYHKSLGDSTLRIDLGVINLKPIN